MLSNYPAGVTNRTIDEHFGSGDSEPDAQKCQECNGRGECSMCFGFRAPLEILDDGDEE